MSGASSFLVYPEIPENQLVIVAGVTYLTCRFHETYCQSRSSDFFHVFSPAVRFLTF
jgi:hypothetical protein